MTAWPVGTGRHRGAGVPVLRPLFPFLATPIAVIAATSLAGAQVMASEKGSVSQTIDGTTITVEYYRPVARGRTPFPDVVHWGRVWTPGANWATTLEVDRPIRLNGNAVPKGRYSVWMIPEPDEWTIILDRDARRFHTQPPSSTDEALRFTVRPATGAHMETLTFYFPVVTRDGATLDVHWATTVIPMRITVEPSRPAELSERERASYTGQYRLTPTGSGGNVSETVIDVSDANGRLRARASPALWDYDPTFDLVPVGNDGEFRSSFYRGGKLFGMEAEGLFAFHGDSAGHATTLELTQYNRVIARGARRWAAGLDSRARRLHGEVMPNSPPSHESP